MFEDSLVESTGRIRTRSKWFAIGSLLFQLAILAVLVLMPYLYPAALPKQAFTKLFLAPPPPMRRAESQPPATAARAAGPVLLSALNAPSRIPQHVAMHVTDTSEPGEISPGFERSSDGPGVMEAILGTDSVPAPHVVAAPKPRSGPLRISAGVAEGRLLTPIRPVYPAIAKSARIQGVVVVEAVISRQGTIENLKVLSGPPLLVQAAVSAIAQARYYPYALNGEPVEVQTTIDVVFRLGE